LRPSPRRDFSQAFGNRSPSIFDRDLESLENLPSDNIHHDEILGLAYTQLPVILNLNDHVDYILATLNTEKSD
jgi:hypothetical protein